MLFWRWNWVVSDMVIRRQVDNDTKSTQAEYMLLFKRNGARIEVPYRDTMFLFSKKRADVIRQALAEKK
jgi:hypothetical protein